MYRPQRSFKSTRSSIVHFLLYFFTLACMIVSLTTVINNSRVCAASALPRGFLAGLFTPSQPNWPNAEPLSHQSRETLDGQLITNN
jgi:hypothetical protein